MARKPTNENKTKVHMYVDTKVVEYFKAYAEAHEIAYQPLMNKVLREYYESLPPEQQLLNPMK